MRFAKPIDENLLHEVFKNYSKIITVKDGCIIGGMGSAVLEFMADNQYAAKVTRLGIPDKWVEHGEQAELYEECGFSPEKIIEEVKNILNPTFNKTNQTTIKGA